MYHSIMVPLDGSPFGEHALPFAADIARRDGASLHLVHVHAGVFSANNTLVEPGADNAERRRAELSYLNEVAQQVAPEGDLAIETTLLDGRIDTALDAYVAANHVDLVAMTTHGRGGFSRLWLGSVADRLVRLLLVPLLLVRPEEAAPTSDDAPFCKHILVPLDGSALAEQIIPHAIALGGRQETEYMLLQVVEPALAGYGRELYGTEFDERVLGPLRADAAAYLDPLAERLRAEGLVVRSDVVVGWSAASILEYASEHEINAIALATHGRGGFARWITGGVADKLVRGATVPVLVYRPRIATH